MTHDPYQTFQTVGAYPIFGAMPGGGLQNPFSSPFNAIQTSAMNPAAAYNPLAANFAAPWNAASNLPQQLATQGYGTQGYPTQGLAGVPNYGNISPQQLQLASLFSAHSGQQPFGNQWQNPFAGALQNAVLSQLSNPILAQAAAALAQQIAQQQITAQHNAGQYGQNYGQNYGQPFGSQFNQPLAPQSWVGQGGIGQINPQGQGHFHPLQLQMAARALQTSGIAPWGVF